MLNVSATPAAALFSLQTAAPVFAFLATQEALYRLFEKTVSYHSSQNPTRPVEFNALKGRIGAFAMAGGLIAGASLIMPSSTLYLTMGVIACLALLALRLTNQNSHIAPAPIYQPTLLPSAYENLSIGELWDQMKSEYDGFITQQAPDFFVNQSHVRCLFSDTDQISANTAIRINETHCLHANWVGAGLTTRRLIAAQYPCSMKTKEDLEERKHFWDVAFKNDALIVDLFGTAAIGPYGYYYPQAIGSQVDYHGTSITCLTQPDIVTTYQVTSNQVTKPITRYVYNAWPDAWPDQGVIPVSELRLLVSHMQGLQAEHPTLMIHCRAGVGRTGTLVAALIIKEKIDSGEITSANLNYHLAQIIVTLRTQRHTFMVQKPEQLILLHKYAKSLLLM